MKHRPLKQLADEKQEIKCEVWSIYKKHLLSICSWKLVLRKRKHIDWGLQPFSIWAF